MFLYSVSTHSHLIVLYKQCINQVVIKKLISFAPLLACIYSDSLKYSETSIKVIPWFCTAHLLLRITRWPP